MMRISPSSFIAGVTLGVLLVGALMMWDSVDVSMMPPELPHATSTALVSATGGAIDVADQPAGTAVFVESVTVPPPGVWVAVREMSGNDMGNVLGAARVSGPRSNITVILLRATQAGRTYAIQLYRDDNLGAFDPAVNSVYVDFDTGARVVAYFATMQ
ncbi:hypothetical protein HYV30_03350 [Candidatus Kaiserbacteria bacterium]|nr:hypothetical protein [Candidatus Kaiserbacteria bacterium]